MGTLLQDESVAEVRDDLHIGEAEESHSALLGDPQIRSGTILRIAFTVLLALLIGIGYLGLSRMTRINAALNDVLGRHWTILQLSHKALAYSGRNSRITMEIFIVSTDKQHIEPLLKSRAESTEKISQLVKEIESRCDSQEDRQLLAAVKDARTQYIKSYLRVLHLLLDEHKPDLAKSLMVEETTPALFKYHTAWDDFIQSQMDQMEKAANVSRASYATARSLVLLLVVLAVFIALSIMVYATRKISQSTTFLEELVAARTGELRVANENIAARKQAELKLEIKAKELARSNAELEKFAYVASHDLQEPLRMVASFTQLLARRYKGKLDADADEFIGFAVDGANRMQQLIQDLLSYSRLTTKRKIRELTETRAACDNAVKNLRQAIEESGVTVTAGFLPVVLGDATQLLQLFQNLISNGIKYRNEHAPEIHVAAKADGNDWVFSVQDNGIGIEAQYFERIFQMFQRLHTRKEYPGTGMGLALCRKIVERHGGSIWVESQPGAGSTFRFTIPQSRGMSHEHRNH